MYVCRSIKNYEIATEKSIYYFQRCLVREASLVTLGDAEARCKNRFKEDDARATEWYKVVHNSFPYNPGARKSVMAEKLLVGVGYVDSRPA